MARHFKTVAGIFVLMGLLLGNMGVARAHNWGSWHWNKGGNQITIRQYNFASNWTAADNARADAWNKIAILYNYASNSHTDVSVFDGY